MPTNETMVAESMRFPALPRQAFQGAPVYLEPMRGSGEWLTVLVAVAGATGAQVLPAIRPDAVRALYGAKAANFMGLVTLVQESLRGHLEQWRLFKDWRPPLAGARLGDVRSLLADDTDHALRQLIVLHASLSAVDIQDRASLMESQPTLSATASRSMRALNSLKETTMLDNLLNLSALIQPAGTRLVRIDHVARQSVQENEVHALDGLPVPAGTYVAVDVTLLIPTTRS